MEINTNKINTKKELLIDILKAIYGTSCIAYTMQQNNSNKDRPKILNKTDGHIKTVKYNDKGKRKYQEIFEYTFKDTSPHYDAVEPLDRVDVYRKALTWLKNFFNLTIDCQILITRCDNNLDELGEKIYACYLILLDVIFYTGGSEEDEPIDIGIIKSNNKYQIDCILSYSKDLSSWKEQIAFDDNIRYANGISDSFDEVEVDDDFINKKHRYLNPKKRREYEDVVIAMNNNLKSMLSNTSKTRAVIKQERLIKAIYFLRSRILSMKCNLDIKTKEETFSILNEAYNKFFLSVDEKMELPPEYRCYIEDILKALEILIDDEKRMPAYHKLDNE